MPAHPFGKGSAGLIVVLDHQTAGDHIHNVALGAPMISFKSTTVGDNAQRYIAKIASPDNGGAGFAGLDESCNVRPVDRTD